MPIDGFQHTPHCIIAAEISLLFDDMDGVDGVFTTELLCPARSAFVRHVHVTKISIWRVYTNSNGDSLNIIRRYNH